MKKISTLIKLVNYYKEHRRISTDSIIDKLNKEIDNRVSSYFSDSQELPNTSTITKAKENTLYYVEGMVSGKLIDNQQCLTVPNAKSIVIDKATCESLVYMLETNKSKLAHRCISVYRDAFICNGKTYNLCLSCGDYFTDDKNIYIDNESEIKSILDNFKNIMGK